MGKVTSKLQITIPKTIAVRFAIRPGDDLAWRVEGRAIRIETASARPESIKQRRALFDDMVRRADARAHSGARPSRSRKDRGWTRAELYQRGRAR